MRYVSPEGRLAGPEAAFESTLDRRGLIWGRARDAMEGGRLWSALLVLLLTLTVARSTTTVQWVTGIDVVNVIAVVAALLMGTLAVLPVREPIALGIGFALSPVVALIGAWPQMHLRHPTDVIGPPLISAWWERINDSSAAQETSFYLFLICLLMWVTGGWLAWCVLRWRKPMLGLIPGAAAFATNLLNVPQDQNGYTLAMLVLTLALLLWTNYSGSIANAQRANVKLTGDARWDFWESGLVAVPGIERGAAANPEEPGSRLRRAIPETRAGADRRPHATSSDRLPGRPLLSRRALPHRPPDDGSAGASQVWFSDQQPVHHRPAEQRAAALVSRQLRRHGRLLHRDGDPARAIRHDLSRLARSVSEYA